MRRGAVHGGWMWRDETHLSNLLGGHGGDADGSARGGSRASRGGPARARHGGAREEGRLLPQRKHLFYLSFASRELARSGPARVVPREVQTWVRSCGVARWCRARCFVEQRVRSRVGNCQLGGGAFFERLGQKAAGSLPRTTEKRRSVRTLSTTKSSAVFAPDAQNCQKISHMMISDETYQIYGWRS